MFWEQEERKKRKVAPKANLMAVSFLRAGKHFFIMGSHISPVSASCLLAKLGEFALLEIIGYIKKRIVRQTNNLFLFEFVPQAVINQLNHGAQRLVSHG